ncbi:MAG: protoporphyrinogen oxidase [Pseudomonadota bacterium]
MQVDVVVVGGGIAGLAAAWRLHCRGIDVLVLESESEAGGNIRSAEVEGFRLERGPHNFMASAEDVFTLASEVEIDDEIVPTSAAAEARFIVRGGRLHQVPSGLWSGLTTGLLSFGAKLKLATEPFRLQRGQPDDTAKQFFDRRFGEEASRMLAGAFINGVYAGDPAILSAPAAFPLFWGFEQETGSMVRGMMRLQKSRAAARKALGEQAPPRRSGLYSMRLGLGQLTGAIARKLGARVRTNHPVTGLQRTATGWAVRVHNQIIDCRRLVLACPPPQAARLLTGIDDGMARSLREIPMAKVAMICLGYRQRLGEVPDGYGFLAPRGEGCRLLGVLFPSRLFDGRTPKGGDLLAAFVGGMLDAEALELDDAALTRLVRDDLKKLLELDAEPSMVRVARYPAAIPQLVRGHLERVVELRQRARTLGSLWLAGNYLHGVGIKDAVRSGFEVALDLAEHDPVAATPARPTLILQEVRP